ncbi:MAG: transposase [Phycisphaerales bacterium]|nr:transposase [Phycisphaerales bacterium]
MKRTRHKPEQIIAKLREADALPGGVATIGHVCQKLGIAEQTFHRGRNQYGGMKAQDAKRLKELERENARLKRVVAAHALDNAMLKELNSGKC